MKIDIDPDCVGRYFTSDEHTGELGTKICATPQGFLEYLQRCPESQNLHNGYAPFCKHVFIPNPYNVLPSAVPIQDVRDLIQTDYIARRANELPVLTRFVRSDQIKSNAAKYIDCILYSHEQMVAEYKAMKSDPALLPDCDWLIISLKYQNEAHETPMQPITMLRNTLIEEGGSGVALDREKYLTSVAYWKNHVEVISPASQAS